MRPKQKSVTMWVMTLSTVKAKSQDHAIFLNCCGETAEEVWISFLDASGYDSRREAEKFGYHVVKGRFVWEEK